MMKLFRSKLLRVILLLILLVGGTAAGYFWRWLNLPLQMTAAAPSSIELSSGDSLHRIGRRYKESLGLTYLKVWVGYARLVGLTQIKRGEFLLDSSLTPISLLQLLNSDDVIQSELTWVEGITVKDALSSLNALPSQTGLPPITVDDVRGLLNIAQDNPEGWLFPDTYRHTKSTSAQELLLQSHHKMKTVLAQEWKNRADGLPYETAYEALIMASIVEKETGVPHERAAIAGVFVRRLEKGMRLQTDPTVIYGLGDDYKGDIKRKHLRQKTPYNTYTIHGLPPTPIALPGFDAIHAALHPAAGDSLYFVAKGDGSHQFSATLAEHVSAVKRFQLNRRENYRSSQ
ncbi:MAG: endolytic transglycosylase MltG [Cellvibrionaceae bacterium]